MDQDTEAVVVVPKAFPQRQPSELAAVTEGRFLSARIEMVNAKPKLVLIYEEAEL